MTIFKDIEEVYDSINSKKIEYKLENIPTDISLKIDEIITGTDSGRGELFEIMDKFTIQYLYTKKLKYKYIKCLLSLIYTYRNSHKEFSLNLIKLKEAMELAIPYIKNYEHLLDESDCEYNHHISSIKHFKRQGYQINVRDGEVKCDNAIVYICKRIDSNIEKLGISFTLSLIRNINKLDKTFYKFSDSSNTPLVPWGFLLNIGLKHTNPNTIKNTDEAFKTFNSIMETAKNYVSLYRLQNYGLKNQYELSFSDPNKLIELITKQVYRDQTFKIEQYNPKSIYSFVSFINKKYDDKILKIITSIFNDLIDKDITNSPINVIEEIKKTKADFSLDDINETINRLTNRNTNTGFFTLKDFSNKNYNYKPFFEMESKSVYINNTFFSVGFYHSIISRLKEIGIDSELGYVLEDFLDSSLQKNNINIILGPKEYDVDLTQREELNIVSHSLESDGIIFNDDEIFFLEQKKRAFNPESIGGDIFSILLDLSISLVHSQTQANRHLRYITKYGKIDFKNGFSLEQNTRRLSKLSISSLDYGGLHSLQYVNQILMSFAQIRLGGNNENERKIRSINKKLDEFNHEIVQSINDGIMQLSPQGFMNCFFLNIFQLLHLVEMSKENGSDLISEINLVRNIRLDQSDFYVIDQYIRNLKKLKPA